MAVPAAWGEAVTATHSPYSAFPSLTHAWGAMKCKDGFLSLSQPVWTPTRELAEEFAAKMWPGSDYCILEFRHRQ